MAARFQCRGHLGPRSVVRLASLFQGARTSSELETIPRVEAPGRAMRMRNTRPVLYVKQDSDCQESLVLESFGSWSPRRSNANDGIPAGENLIHEIQGVQSGLQHRQSESFAEICK
jgi:hypothetical protein